MKLAGLQKLTLLDFPGRTAATVFLPGCNFRCPFCHNADLVTAGGAAETPEVPGVPVEEFFAFLDKRHGLLDGVCITGGEPLLQPDLADFCARIKQAGFAVKLDTNGSFPERLRDLVEAGLVDYVAMDVKNTLARYAETVGVPAFDTTPVRASLDYLRSDTVPYEFRTTVVRELHTPDDLRALARDIEGADAWYLQSFVDTENVLAGPDTLHPWDPADLEALLPDLRHHVPNTHLRGV